MAREYDTQLIESVAVRRARMRELLLWGRQRRVRATGDGFRWLRIGLVLAAVACAGCVGWSFLKGVIADQQKARNPPPAQSEGPR
ncbi:MULTISPECIES: hypothetical protein [Micromonospora]|uniref:Uncharacterized protein n=1 Tax=Micromonospora chokoriensis TaxID=356851 RepID=A0A1C4VGU2_9ACTN|nr:hypothetical protein [Micromonospora chokoriensis]SCE83041.1 hypothetical protein GA0070612_1408 [Micromonospora chokoriensis]